MPWYDYILCFFAGTTLASGVPHFIKGICGEPFPSFARTGAPGNRSSFTGWKSPGKGFSSPVANVLEGIFDFLIGAALFISGHVSTAHPTTLIAFIAGIICTSLILSYRFSRQQPPGYANIRFERTAAVSRPAPGAPSLTQLHRGEGGRA